MQTFTLSADKIYALSKSVFFNIIPDCEVNFIDGGTQMFFNLRNVAAGQHKKERRQIAALVISKCTESRIKRFAEWLTDYFSEDMQEELFSLTVDEKGAIIPDKMLEKALKNIRKR